MVSRRITVRIPESLGARLRARCRDTAQTLPEVIRVAIETSLCEGKLSAYELAKKAGLIGCVGGAPGDLSTGRRHFEHFENDKPRPKQVRVKRTHP